jgi:hypothetical protein
VFNRALVGYHVVLIALALLALGIFACGGGSEPDAEDVQSAVDEVGGAESEVCADLNTLESALSGVTGLAPSSTVDQAEDVQNEVEEAFDDVRSSVEDLNESRVDALETAHDAFRATIDDLDGDQTLSQAAATILSMANEIRNSLSGIEEGISCP